MYGREKLTIKGRASRRVFPSKNALQTKRPVFYSPGEFTGRGSETHLHKRKVEILRFRAKRELSSNLPPKRKKPTRRPVGGEFWKWWAVRDSNSWPLPCESSALASWANRPSPGINKNNILRPFRFFKPEKYFFPPKVRKISVAAPAHPQRSDGSR